MNNKQNRLTRFYAIIFVGLLCLPALGYFLQYNPGKKLFGYVEIHTSKPENLLKGWFGKQLQPHLEEVVTQDLGLRALLVRLYNDFYFRLFGQSPRLDLISTRNHGLYFGYSIAHLNDEYTNREKLAKTYNEFALQLAEIQTLLAARGQHFEVIIASSKPYVYLDDIPRRYLVDDNLYANAVSLGPILKAHGVNVIDAAPILRDLNEKKSIETHARSGVHWNHYSGCIIAKHLFNDIKTTFADAPTLRCGAPEYKRAELVDRDGYWILNTKSRVGLVRKTAYPNPKASFSTDYLPNMLIVGDSFMYQIINAIDLAKSYSSINVSSYYRTNIIHKPGDTLTFQDPAPAEQVERGVFKAAMKTDIVILEMVDYNIPRLGYGFTTALLKRLKEES